MRLGKILCLLISCITVSLLNCAAAVPPECFEIATCSNSKKADWVAFRERYNNALQMQERGQEIQAAELMLRLADEYAMDADTALDCRLAAGAVFYKLGQFYLKRGFAQRAHNLHQLTMAMMWDTSRSGPEAIQCLDHHEMWGVRWPEYMQHYLTLAAELRRNDPEGLPPSVSVPKDFRSNLNIGVVSLCDYPPGSPLPSNSLGNREPYTKLYGYTNLFHTKNDFNRHPVWGAMALTLRHLKTNQYDWLMWVDCDSMFVDMTRTVDFLIYTAAGRTNPHTGQLELDPNVHFIISEDGRGLAGGNWIVRNSRQGIAFLEDVYGESDERKNPFMRHDLKDQFSLLWHLVRPRATAPVPPTPSSIRRESEGRGGLAGMDTWDELEWLPEVRLLPQQWINSYPWMICRHTHSHRCFEDGHDFMVSFPTMGGFSKPLMSAMLEKFLHQSLNSIPPHKRAAAGVQQY
eukprot:GDKI01027437.1.p1 GENE.GDKI01027437.1~~GDKI01027437.1.p1  ORF type:complete len:461 (+),score=90.85 GDKI01027437.1:53-1435(+)